MPSNNIPFRWWIRPRNRDFILDTRKWITFYTLMASAASNDVMNQRVKKEPVASPERYMNHRGCRFPNQPTNQPMISSPQQDALAQVIEDFQKELRRARRQAWIIFMWSWMCYALAVVNADKYVVRGGAIYFTSFVINLMSFAFQLQTWGRFRAMNRRAENDMEKLMTAYGMVWTLNNCLPHDRE